MYFWTLLRMLALFTALAVALWTAALWPSLSRPRAGEGNDPGSSRGPRSGPVRVAMVAVGLAALTLGGAAVTVLSLGNSVPAGAVLQILPVWLCGLVLAAPAAARICLGRPEPWAKVAGRCLSTSVLVGVGSLAAVFLLEELVGRFVGYYVGFLGDAPGTLILAAVASLAFGALWLMPLRRVKTYWCFDSREAVDLSLRACGLWLAISGVTCLALCVVCSFADSGIYWSWSCYGPAVLYVSTTALGIGVGIIAAVVTALGAGAMAIGSSRIRRRRDWLERVRQGEEPEWRIGSPEDPSAVAHLRPLFHADELPKDLLERRATTLGDGAYRSGERFVPWALV